MKGDSVCMLFQNQKPHPAHKVFGDAVDADYRHFETGGTICTSRNTNQESDRIRTGLKMSRDYDIVISEGTAPLQTLLPYKIFKNKDALAIYLAADETFKTLGDRSSRYLWEYGLGPISNRVLDGCIAVGKDVYNWGSKYVGELPVEIVHPPISQEKYHKLLASNVRSPTNPFIILSTGIAKEANNFNLLAEVGEKMRRKEGDRIQTVILGEGHEYEQYASYEGVLTPGYVPIEEFVDWHSRASVYVQPSMGDSYPVASLEGMLSGTPTIVTEDVGTRHRLPDRNVSKSTKDSISQKVREIYESDEADRIDCGRKLRQNVVTLTVENQKEEFKNAVRSIQNDSNS